MRFYFWSMLVSKMNASLHDEVLLSHFPFWNLEEKVTLTLSPDWPHRDDLLIQLFGIVTAPPGILWTALKKRKQRETALSVYVLEVSELLESILKRGLCKPWDKVVPFLLMHNAPLTGPLLQNSWLLVWMEVFPKILQSSSYDQLQAQKHGSMSPTILHEYFSESQRETAQCRWTSS